MAASGAPLTSQWNIEVPIAQFSKLDEAPLREVPGGDAVFQFRGLPPGEAKAGKSLAIQGSTSCSRALVWQLEGSSPRQLLLSEVAVNQERRDSAARLAFSAPLLPSVACVDSPQGGVQATRLAVVTADGTLHSMLLSSSVTVGQPGSTALGLARQLAAPDVIISVPLASIFQRAGAPTAISEAGGLICVGTEEGNVVALPIGATDPAAAVLLTPASGISKMFGGLFGRAGGMAVKELAELRLMDRRLLCAIHEGGQLRLWDLHTRRLVHTDELLHPNLRVTPTWVPTMARLTGEPLDASAFHLLVYFEPASAAAGSTHSADGAGVDASIAGVPAQRQPGMLATYQLMLEHRGDGAYKVDIDPGATMRPGTGGVHRLIDLAVESLALHTIGAWILYDDAEGKRNVHCVPVAFQDGAVQPGEVHLLEDQLRQGCHTDASTRAVEEEMWRAAESQLASTGTPLSPAALGSAFADAVLAPGRLSRHALHAALAALGSGVPREAVVGADLAELSQQLPRWIAAIPAAAAAGGAAGGSATTAVLARWSALLEAYAKSWQEAHLPLALLQLPPQGDSQALIMLARRGGMVTALRHAAAPELALRAELAPDWQGGAEAAEKVRQTTAVLEAAAAVYKAAGNAKVRIQESPVLQGSLCRLVWACMQQGQDPGTTIIPALVRSLMAGPAATPPQAIGPSAGRSRLGFPGIAGGAEPGGGASGAAVAQWRAACRQLPLKLAQLCSSGSFGGCVAAAVEVLGTNYVDASRIRSKMPAITKPVRDATLASLAQVAWAQLEVLLQLALLLQYLQRCHTLGNWVLPLEDAEQLESTLLPSVLSMLRAAGTAYWAAVTPLEGGAPVGGELGGLGGEAAAMVDPAQMVVALRIGEGGGGAAAAKRARVAPPVPDSFVASLLLAAAAGSQAVHVVRDMPDLQRVCLLFPQYMLCLHPSPIHTAGSRRIMPSPAEERGQLAPEDQAADICAALLQGRHTPQLAALQRLLPRDSQDMRLLFFRACSQARQIALASSAEDQRLLEEQSCSLFFRVAAVFSRGAAFPGQAEAVGRCVQQMLADMNQAAEPVGEGPQAAELQYYEALMLMYERMGRYNAAARCALAAARQVAAAMPRPDQLAPRAQAQGRLWASVFSCMMEAGRFEEAYVALLSNEVAEVQLDCLHRLVAGLCAAPGGVELLCRLPFAQNLLLMRGRRQTWVPLVEEVVATLERRAAQLDLRTAPQPYKVLADFHICRSNYQAAAGAMLAYARRLVAECPEEPPQLAEAERALAAAVSCLSLLERQHAWVEDPAPPMGSDASMGENGLEEPPVLTLAALQREYAIVRGHAAVAAAMPGGQQGHATLAGGGGGELRGADAEDVFAQLLALGLHDDAFQLAEAAFVGTQLTRALERVFASLAATCVKQQVARADASSAVAGDAGASSADAMLAQGGSDDMDVGETAGQAWAAAWAGDGQAAGAARAEGGTGADWRRLKSWLSRHESGSHRFRLRLVILEAMLRVEPAFMLPPWLMSALQPPSARASAAAAPSSADLGGALRVLMRHARLADAATLAAQHLQAVLHSVPSVAMARTSQVCFPHALLDELLMQLGAQPGLAAEKQQVGALLAKVRGAAAKQTAVIQQLHAQ